MESLNPKTRRNSRKKKRHGASCRGYVLPGGQSAYATSEYSIKAKVRDRQLDSGGLETLVLVKSSDGTWKIRHSHTSSRARRPQVERASHR